VSYRMIMTIRNTTGASRRSFPQLAWPNSPARSFLAYQEVADWLYYLIKEPALSVQLFRCSFFLSRLVPGRAHSSRGPRLPRFMGQSTCSPLRPRSRSQGLLPPSGSPWPFAFTRSTANPVSSLWKVTRSINPDNPSCGVADGGMFTLQSVSMG
jgi:hypothetical protein